MSGLRSQRGTAVIIAMLVLALAVAGAAAMLERQDLDTRALQSQRDYEQARWMLRGGMHWARSILAEDARAGASDHRRELWASGLPPTDVHGDAPTRWDNDPAHQPCGFTVSECPRDLVSHWLSRRCIRRAVTGTAAVCVGPARVSAAA